MQIPVLPQTNLAVFLFMAKDSYYFRHDSTACDDPKIMIMISEWGLEAYGIYWVIIEHLRNQPDYKSHLKILKPLSMRHNSSEEKFSSVVSRYGLFIVENDVFFSPSLISRMRPMEEKKIKMKELADKRWGNNAHVMRTHSVGNAIREDKIREDKRIEDGKSKEMLVPHKDEIIYTIEHCLSVAMLDSRWVKANKTTETELKSFNSMLEKQGIYEKNPFEYKTHFANWKRKSPQELTNSTNNQQNNVKITLK